MKELLCNVIGVITLCTVTLMGWLLAAFSVIFLVSVMLADIRIFHIRLDDPTFSNITEYQLLIANGFGLLIAGLSYALLRYVRRQR